MTTPVSRHLANMPCRASQCPKHISFLCYPHGQRIHHSRVELRCVLSRKCDIFRQILWHDLNKTTITVLIKKRCVEELGLFEAGVSSLFLVDEKLEMECCIQLAHDSDIVKIGNLLPFRPVCRQSNVSPSPVLFALLMIKPVRSL